MIAPAYAFTSLVHSVGWKRPSILTWIFSSYTRDHPAIHVLCHVIKKTLLDADLIRAAQELRFPDFSNDGEYLEVHYIDDILNNLGGPRDDFQNHFTARLLLLLESRPLYNESFYENVMKKIIYSYYRDYHDHEDSFSPIFLINDIIRFWRTLCLNYEHRRESPSRRQ